MPLIIQGYLFDIVPKKSPFYIRPILNTAFGQLTQKLVQPQMKNHLSMVSPFLHPLARSLKIETYFFYHRLKHISKSPSQYGSPEDQNQLYV